MSWALKMNLNITEPRCKACWETKEPTCLGSDSQNMKYERNMKNTVLSYLRRKLQILFLRRHKKEALNLFNLTNLINFLMAASKKFIKLVKFFTSTRRCIDIDKYQNIEMKSSNPPPQQQCQWIKHHKTFKYREVQNPDSLLTPLKV